MSKEARRAVVRLTRGFLVPLLLALPIVSAASAEGIFSVEDQVTLRDEVKLSGDVLALFAQTDSDLRSLRIEAARVVVHAYSENFNVRAGAVILVPPATKEQTNYTLTDVSMRLTGTDHDGWIGLYPEAMAASMLTSEASLRGKMSSAIGNSDSPEAAPEPDRSSYSREIREPHIRTEVPGFVELRGDGALKLLGPDVEYLARESSGTFRTGIDQTAGMTQAGTYREQWLFLELEGAVLVLDDPRPIQVATSALRADWAGEAHFIAATGSLEQDGIQYAGSGMPASLWGAFTGSFTPSSEEDGAMQVSLAGEVVRTTLPEQQRALAARVVSSPTSGLWLLGGAVVASVLVGGGAVLLRRRSGGDLTLDELVDLANIAAEEQRFGAALDWVRRARALAPRNGRLATDEAFYLAALGEVDQALARYAEAAQFTESGEPEFLAGALLLDAGGEVAEAEALMLQALGRNPTYALELEDMPAARRLQGRPAFERAMADARRRLT